jgi:hypothetical protein
MNNESSKVTNQDKSIKNYWFSSFLGQTKILNILRLSLKNDTPSHLIIRFSSCFQNVESIGQQNLTFTSVLHKAA